MTVHPRAADFIALQETCDAVQAAKIGSTNDSEVLKTTEAWYQQDRADLITDLQQIGVEPLAILRGDHWAEIRQLYGLYDLQMLNGYIRVKMPAGWKESKVVVSEAVGYEGQEAHYQQYSSLALRQSATLEDADLLRLLMPELTSRQWGGEILSDDLTVSIELAPPPVRAQVTWHRLQNSGAPVHIAADKSAIAFSPPLNDQLRGGNEAIQHKVRRWKDFEPIIAVPKGSAVALVDQWGNYLFEKIAVSQAINAG